MIESEWVSDFTGSFHNYLSPGCEICHQGASLVLFVTGLCNRDCFYCPLSEGRRNKDVIFANERKASGIEDILEEGRAIGALGTGITGGEPLLKKKFVIECIKALKKEFGEGHHVHLYTGSRPGPSSLRELKRAGLDEIRFHPPLEDWNELRWLPDLLAEAKHQGLLAGVEIPALSAAPKVILAVRSADAFLNLNELEFSETNQQALKVIGFEAKDASCAAVGSEDIAREYFMNECINVHYCSSRFKDAVQLRERLKRRAERVCRPFDLPTEDGTLICGTADPSASGLGCVIRTLEEMNVPQDMYTVIDGRIDIAGWILEDISRELKKIGCELALEERYPVEDGPVVERIPL